MIPCPYINVGDYTRLWIQPEGCPELPYSMTKSHNRYELNGKPLLISQEEDSELSTPSSKAEICFAVLEAGRSETVIRASTEMNGKFLVALVMLH